MANELNLRLDPIDDAGLSLTGKVRAPGGAQEGSNVAMTEANAGYYTGSFSVAGVSDGVYSVEFIDDGTGNLLGLGEIYVKNNAEIHFPTLNNLALATIEGSSILAKEATVSAKASQASVDNVDSKAIDILADTNELQTNQGNFATASGFATPANVTAAQNAIVAEVDANETKIDAIKAKTDQLNFTGSDLQSIASNMRGTDGANTTAPLALATIEGSSILAKEATVSAKASQASLDAVGAIATSVLADTDELQTNQGNFITATGFATPANVTAAQGAVQSDIAAQTVDLKGSSAKDLTEVFDNTPSVDLGTMPADVTAVKAKTDQLNFTGSDLQSVASNMRGTDGANTTAPDNAGITQIQSDIAAQTVNLKGSSGKDLTEVFDNTPSVDLGTMPADVTAIKAKTDNLPGAPAAVSDIPTASAIALEILDENDTV